MTSEQQIDYKDTLNLPKGGFPMKAKLPEREPERFARWEEEGLREQILKKREGAPVFCLHDGPPYANGHIHIGHALNKVLKDVIVRYKNLSGFRAYFRPGFDCHGLPIEQKVLQELADEASSLPTLKIRRQCRQYADKWVKVQTREFKRLGVMGDWDNAYLTMSNETVVGILGTLRELVVRGLVRKGFRPNYWDPVFRTVLAEAEIEYETHTSDSVYVKFPLNESESVELLKGLADVSIVIWTTTPWTLPANLGVCLHPGFEYVVLEAGGRHFIVARELAEPFKQACDLLGATQVATVAARDLERKTCAHPIFKDKPSLVILGEHVTLEQGTGCVHTAPGHGLDDFSVGERYGLPVFVPVDEAGCFTDEYPEMEGVNVFEANPRIVEKLKADGLLLAHGRIEHQYPHSWRSHKPIIFRATEQWFVELDEGGVRKRAIEAIDKVQWIPEWGRERILGMVEQRPDWCISRQRAWGVPIPSIRSKTGGKSILDPRIINKCMVLTRQKGDDAWWSEPLESFWPAGFRCEETGEDRPDQFEKETDILDVWFDSGATSIAVCELDKNLTTPADLYLEGGDQHRGWFQSSLLLRVAVRGGAPYRQAMTHGWTLDGQGLAMSKSKGNVISPQEIVDKMGADGLRLWVISEDYRADVTISHDILKRIQEAYRRIRNTFKFLIGNLYDFDAEKDAVAVGDLEEFDRWVLGRLNALIHNVRRSYDLYEFHRIYHNVYNFCTVQLSALYLDVIKDRLYCSAPDDPTRRAAQTVCHHLANRLTRLMAPILIFTADEVWQAADLGPEPNIHLTDFPEPRPDWEATDLDAKWDALLELRGEVSRALEDLRRAKTIGQSLEAAVHVRAKDAEDYELLGKNVEILKNLFIVSRVDVEQADAAGSESERTIRVDRAPGEKCQRCWMYDSQVGADTEHPDLCPRCVDVVRRVA